MKATLCILLVLPLALCAGCTTYFETPTSSTTTTTTTRDLSTFSSRVVRGGFASRSFTLASASTIQATLTDVTPSVPVGLGVGIPQSDGGACHVTESVETTAGTAPQISIPADAGTYCVKVFDVGHIAEEVSFSLTVSHP